MTIKGDLAAALSTRLGCSLQEAAEHVRFIMSHADDPNFAQRFDRESGWDHAFEIYGDVVRFLRETA